MNSNISSPISSSTSNTNTDKLVSFVIPHKGRETMLLQTLDSIKQQTLDADKYEVIIVSQNENVSHTLAEYERHFSLTVMHNDDANSISHSRNIGAAKATGTYLAFLDADVSLAANYATIMFQTLQQTPSLALAAAMQINSEHAPPLERIRTALSNAELDTTVSFLPGRNLFLHRDTFATVGGFPEHLLTCEDYYFTGQVSEHGGLYYTSKTHYVHLGEDKAFGPMFKKEIWRGQSNIASTSGRPIPLRELPSFIVPFAVTLGVLFLLICLLYSHTNFAIMFSIIAGAPLLAYTFRLKKLVGKTVSFFNCLRFYLVYFPARAIGTVLGVRGAVTTSSHK
ncbi:glycosyltransferase [Alteromonas sp. A081]|uniref:glycosyltransferase n=1 Tax=Alteromonas sp. A081 TaxID=3410269 RepID=UPI003B9815FE